MFAQVDAVLEGLLGHLGFPMDQVHYFACLAALFPLGFMFRQLRTPTGRHVFAATAGFLLGWFVFREGMLHTLFSSTVVYALLRRGWHRTGIAFSFLYIFVSHIYRLYTSYLSWSLDYTGPQMMITLKLCSLALNLRDGARLKECTLYKEQRRLALSRPPSLVEFFSYIYFFPTFSSGPIFEMQDYLDFVDGSVYASHGCTTRPSVVRPTCSKIMQGLACLAVVFYGETWPKDVLTTDEYMEQAWLQRWTYQYVVVTFVKFKFYMAWKLAEAACNLVGFGFNGFDEHGEARWDLVTNIEILGVELPSSIKGAMDAWHVGVAKWLRRYVYTRLLPVLSSPFGAAMATYTVSGTWHGFYPGYYMTFSFGAPTLLAARVMRNRVRPFFLQADGSPARWKWLYDFGGTVATLLFLHYACTPFVLLAFSWSFRIWVLSNYLLIHGVTALVIAVDLLLRQAGFPPPSKKPTKAA